jgi:two-component sensor histidine kinase
MRLVPSPTLTVDDQSNGSLEGGTLALITRPTLRLARQRLREHLTTHGLDPDDACLILSELASNSLLHAGDTAAIAWHLHGNRLRIGVADASALGLAVIEETCTREGGRGLLLVEQLAHRWGVRPLGPLGKECWVELHLKAT